MHSQNVTPLVNVASVSGNSTSAPPSRNKKLVLIVDDHEDTRCLLRYVLEHKGHSVIEAVDGEEAVSAARSRFPDLIVMDSSLKLVDGPEATRQIRSIQSLRNVPIVFLSGHAQPQAREAALACGANDYLVKPVCLDVLELCVEQQLQNARAAGQTQ